MKEKENIIDALEKMKASIKDIDTNIKMIDVSAMYIA